MDSHQWRDWQQSGHQPSAGLRKLQFVDWQQQQSPAPALSLFAPEPRSNINEITIINPSLSPFPRMGYFTLAQRQELELQALIYKYMISGVSVPLELVLPIKRSLLSASPYYQAELYQHLYPSLLQAGYWGRYVVDPEPGRCRRTDGKKWRCSREVAEGQKYCEHHAHRSRNRSRKHVEIPTPTPIDNLKNAVHSLAGSAKENHFNLSGSLPMIDILPLNLRHPDVKTVGKSLQSNCPNYCLQELKDKKPEGYVLQRFFDECPKSQREPDETVRYTSHPASSTHFSISIPANPSSDFSLKLSTGITAEYPRQDGNNGSKDGQMVQHINNWSGWGHHGGASMGGPLAEAFHSSTSTPSPPIVLHKPNGPISETRTVRP